MTNAIQSAAPEATSAPESVADFCSLSPGALTERLDWIRSDIEPHAGAKRILENGVAWDFEATPEMREKLEKLARLESDCCSSLEFEVWQNPSRTRLRFEILGADPGSEFFDRLKLANLSDDEDTPGGMRWGLLAKRGGIAAVASFLICCVLPFALVSVLGISIAAPLLALDTPLAIGTGAVVIGGVLWFVEKRRSAKIASVGAGTKALSCDC